MIVHLLLPKRTFERTRYILMCPVHLAGVTVPAGFITDGASVPRLLWWLFPPVGRYFLAAVVHDWLLENGMPWREANRKFKQALQEQAVPVWVVFSMFLSVQIYQFFKREVFCEGGIRRAWRR